MNNQNGENLGSFGGANNAYTYSDNPMWQFSDALSYIRGAHTLTVGADYKRWTLYRNNANNFLGEYTFGDATATGNEVADFLLGYYERANGFMPAPLSPPNSTNASNLHDYNFQYDAAFLQDDWKVNDKLTLNLGLRWDLRPIPYLGRQSLSLDRSHQSPRRPVLRRSGARHGRRRTAGQWILRVLRHQPPRQN